MNASNADKTITIYCRYIREDETVVLMRRVLYRCSWEDQSISTAMQTGKILKESASIRVFCKSSGKTYIPPHEWYVVPEDELDNYWTVDQREEAQPLIVPFECAWEAGAGTRSDIVRAENAFIRAHPGALRVVQCNDNRKQRGSHIRLQA